MKKISAVIVDIQTDKEKGFALVGVEVTIGKKKVHKAFRINPTEKVTFEDFKLRLRELIQEDIDKERNVEDNLKVLKKHKGVQFTLEIPKNRVEVK